MIDIASVDESIEMIELEITRKGIIAGIDWMNAGEIQFLACRAREILAQGDLASLTYSSVHSVREIALRDLCALTVLMLRVIERSAKYGYPRQGGQVWKSFIQAMWMDDGMQGDPGNDGLANTTFTVGEISPVNEMDIQPTY